MQEVTRKKEYLKKVNNRKCKRFAEYKSLYFSSGASLFIGFLLLLFSYDTALNSFHMAMVGAGIIYLIQAIFQYFLLSILWRQIVHLNQISPLIRKLGFILIVLLVFGNIFAAIAGFTLVKREKSLEYTTTIYAFINSIAVIMVTLLNLYKEYVANTFMASIGVMGGIAIFYLICLWLLCIWEKNDIPDRKLMPIAVLLILTGITGNFFGPIVGIILITRYKNLGQDRSIEWIDIFERLYRNNMALIGMLMVMFLISISLTSFFTFDYAMAIDNNYSAILQPISLEYPFGTDNFGRCVFTRIIFGARISLTIGICVTLFPLALGGALGAFAGYYGARTDNIIMRLLDILYAVPSILLAIAIVAAFGAGTFNLVIALSIGSIAMYARTVRATVMGLSDAEFVEAARACGAKDKVIIFKHIIPNSLAPIIVRATMEIGSAVLATSSLSYLGLGVEPHIPEWGNILKIGSKYLESHPHLAIFPGLAIILLVLAFNFFGDGLRDALDPKLK